MRYADSCFYFIKEILEVKGNLEQDLGREPREDELTEATNMTVVQLREKLVVGLAARNKLIKVSIFYSSFQCQDRISGYLFNH